MFFYIDMVFLIINADIFFKNIFRLCEEAKS